MKIWFNDRCLILLQPGEEYHEKVILSESFENLQELIRDFENDFTIPRMAITTSDGKRMRRVVKSLCTLVEAAGGVVKNKQGEILFIFRRGKWDLPKGKIQADKRTGGKADRRGEACLASTSGQADKRTVEARHASPKQADRKKAKSEWRKAEAVREVKEETGLKRVSVVGELSPTYHVFKARGRMMLKKCYWFEMTAPRDQLLIPQQEEDIEFVKWFRPDELNLVQANTFGSLREMIEHLRC